MLRTSKYNRSKVDDSAAQKERIIAAAYSIGAKQGLAAISARSHWNTGFSWLLVQTLSWLKSDIMVAAAATKYVVSNVDGSPTLVQGTLGLRLCSSCCPLGETG